MKQHQEFRNDVFYFIRNIYLVAVKLDFIFLNFETIFHFREIQNAGKIERIIHIKMNPKKRWFAERVKLFIKILVIFIGKVRWLFSPRGSCIVDLLIFKENGSR